MRVIDPGHKYELAALDGDAVQVFQFVKREGAKYPGNTGTACGTTIQETLRMDLDRLAYLDGQAHSAYNRAARFGIETAIHALECRAAEIHGRALPTIEAACYGPQCPRCLHVQCAGNCHRSPEQGAGHRAAAGKADVGGRNRTMESERDPRIDPRPGDVVKVDGLDISVQGVDEDGYIQTETRLGISWHPSPAWRMWVKSAEIIHVGGASPQAQEPGR